MAEVATKRIWPASIRVVDNKQFQFAMAFKEKNDSIAKDVLDSIKKFFLLNVKGYDQNKMCACTLVYEGNS